MIRRPVQWFAGVFLWPFQALYMRWDDWQQLGEWADAVTDDTDITNPGPLASTGTKFQQRRADR